MTGTDTAGAEMSTDRLKGSVKEAIGKVTGDRTVEAEGRREKRGANPATPMGTDTDSVDPNRPATGGSDRR